MSDWQLSRKWQAISSGRSHQSFETPELLTFQAACLLGTAGMGKSYEIDRLVSLMETRGIQTFRYQLSRLATSAESFEIRLRQKAQEVQAGGVLLLDGLDQAMQLVPTAGLIVAAWIREELMDSKPRIIISCRSTVWPADVEQAFCEVYGENTITLVLAKLDVTDQRSAALAEGVKDDLEFVRAVRSARAEALACQPLTLRMLLALYLQKRPIVGNRCDLFREGIVFLCQDRIERRGPGNTTGIALGELITSAERLATYVVLSGCEAVTFADDAVEGCVSWRDLEMLPAGGQQISERVLKAISLTGLVEFDDSRQVRFSHRQLSEYLAGRRLAQLPLHQAQAMLANPPDTYSGVASSLRETAAFAASLNPSIAHWITATDPEVIGLSDIADDSLRRQAALAIVQKCRSHEITDVQILHEEIVLNGLQYEGARSDLRAFLEETGPDLEDMYECVIKMIERWNLIELSDNLVQFFFDREKPIESRKAAGYALTQIATASSKALIRQSIDSLFSDSEGDVKGLALRCLWPDHLTVHELLDRLTPRAPSNYSGAYDGLLFELARRGFAAEGARIRGLQWARSQIATLEGTVNHEWRIIQNIVHASLAELDDPDLLSELVHLLLECDAMGRESPLSAIDRDYSNRLIPDEECEPPLKSSSQGRRKILAGLSLHLNEHGRFPFVVFRAPGLIQLADCIWIFETVLDQRIPLSTRNAFAELLSNVPWITDSKCVDYWLEVRDREPIASAVRLPTFIEFKSDAEKQAREWHRRFDQDKTPTHTKSEILVPSPSERVADVLSLSELKDPEYFCALCQQMTLEPHSRFYGFSRFLTMTPGWRDATPPTRQRIVAAAKLYLDSDTELPSKARWERFDSSQVSGMAAIWLIQDLDSHWLVSRSEEWWNRWSWYILCETRPDWPKEPNDIKRATLLLLHENAPVAFRDGIVSIAIQRSAIEGEEVARIYFESMLILIETIADEELDRRLSEEISGDRLPADLLCAVTQFVLRRNPQLAQDRCLQSLVVVANDGPLETSVALATALLLERPSEFWTELITLFRLKRDLARATIVRATSPSRLRWRGTSQVFPPASLGILRIGELTQLLFELFTPQTDPKDTEVVSPSIPEPPRELRNNLVTWLGNQVSRQAVNALRDLERTQGPLNSWLRRPRARAESSLRRLGWHGIALESVSQILDAQERRLLRSEKDVVDGISVALQQYEADLRQTSPSHLEDFWNTPAKRPSTPKSEERVSEKLCAAVRQYFQDYAVVADREVQIFRRKIPAAEDGEAGSEVDLLVTLPARGSTNGIPICIPIEVKLSCNKEAKSGLKDQLVDRYMRQIGANVGIFLVAWFDAPNIAKTHKPVWQSIGEARSHLSDMVKAAKKDSGVEVHAIVLDVQLT